MRSTILLQHEVLVNHALGHRREAKSSGEEMLYGRLRRGAAAPAGRQSNASASLR